VLSTKDGLTMTTKSFGIAFGLMAGVLTVSGLMPMAAVAQDAPAQASQAGTKNLGSFTNWTAWQGTDANGMICYVSSAPQDMKPTGVNRDPVHFLVINRKGLGVKHEVQTLIGYPFNAQSANASATIDGKTYPMVTEGSAAWLASANDEDGFVAAMKAGATLVVKGTSQRGTDTTDTYSLSGVTAALEAMQKACS
jgi:hypothetical protein